LVFDCPSVDLDRAQAGAVAARRTSASTNHAWMRMRICDDVYTSHGHDVDLAYLSADTARIVAETMQALATPSRVRILSRLGARDVEMEQPAVSQQLRVLRHLGLVVGERHGRQTIYELHDDHVGMLLAEAVSHAEHLRLGLAAHAAREAVNA
jgi:DNA-binding transcriptional ArsR family regulator